MGNGVSRECSTCQKEKKGAVDCFQCKKVVCMEHSTKVDYSNSGRVRICITCNVNKMAREGANTGAEEMKISKVKGFQKMITIKHDSKTDTYSGLPVMWRDLLEMPVGKSKNEIDTSSFDSSVAPVAPSKKQLYIIKEKNADGAFVISAPQSVEKTFQIKYDQKLGRLVGAPENLQQYLEGFKKEDIEANPEAVLMAADRARQMAED